MKFLGTKDYISTEDLSVAVNASITLEKPLLVKGEPGTGKTELARQIASSLKLKIIEWNMKVKKNKHAEVCFQQVKDYMND